MPLLNWQSGRTIGTWFSEYLVKSKVAYFEAKLAFQLHAARAFESHGIVVPYNANTRIEEDLRKLPRIRDRTHLFFGQWSVRKDGGIRDTLTALDWSRYSLPSHVVGGEFMAFTGTNRTRVVEEYATLAMSSRFCLNPRGDTRTSRRFADSVLAGCIPVIISDGIQLPFSAVIPWKDIAYFVPEKSLSKSRAFDMLAATPVSELQQRQNLLLAYASLLRYGNGRRPSVAFHCSYALEAMLLQAQQLFGSKKGMSLESRGAHPV